MHVAQGRCRQRDAVRKRECRDRLQEHPQVAHHQHQAENEQQVVGSEHDVLETVHEIGGCNASDPLRGSDFDPGLRRMHERGSVSAIERLHPHQNIGDGRLQAHEFDALAGKAGLAGVDPSTLKKQAGKLFQRWRGDVARIVGKFQHHRQSHPGIDRRAPQHLIAARRRLVDLKVGRA